MYHRYKSFNLDNLHLVHHVNHVNKDSHLIPRDLNNNLLLTKTHNLMKFNFRKHLQLPHPYDMTKLSHPYQID